MRSVCSSIARSALRVVAGLGVASLIATMTAGSAPAARVAVAPVTVARVTAGPEMIRAAGAAGQFPPTDAQCEATFQISCFTPDQIEAAYNLPALYKRGITGRGRTIVIVDAYGSPTITDDLMQFDAYTGYGTPPFRVIQYGKVPPFDPSDSDMLDWASETSLDVESAHAGAPLAKIVLVEAASQDAAELAGAVDFAATHRLGDVISLSWGYSEQSLGPATIRRLDRAFRDAASRHITVVASSGDAGPFVGWPATNPLVTAVGGTELSLSDTGSRTGPDVAWNDTYNVHAQDFFFGNDGPDPLATGGGLSSYYSRPAYQNGVRKVTGTHRGNPDISMSASCSVAVNIYESFPGTALNGWAPSCGTSESAPMFAAVVALAAQLAGHPLGPVNAAIYKLAAKRAPGIVPVKSGNNTVTYSGTTYPGYAARPGYNLATGTGTVNGAYFVPELAKLG